MTGPYRLIGGRYIPVEDLNRDPEIVAAIKEASLKALRATEEGDRRIVAFVVSHRQFQAMKRSLPDIYFENIPNATLWSVQVLVTDDGWSCPSNLTDLRGVTDA